MKTGLQADTYIEAHAIKKQKLSYGDMELDGQAEKLVINILFSVLYNKVCSNIVFSL
jgi:hypothetical protein